MNATTLNQTTEVLRAVPVRRYDMRSMPPERPREVRRADGRVPASANVVPFHGVFVAGVFAGVCAGCAFVESTDALGALGVDVKFLGAAFTLLVIVTDCVFFPE